MDNKLKFYAICVEKTLAICVEGEEKDQVDLNIGMLVAVEDKHDRYSTVIIHDFYRKNMAFENNMYLVKTSALRIIPPALWPFFAAVSDPLDRVFISKDQLFMDYLMSIKEDALVVVDGRYFIVSPQESSYTLNPRNKNSHDYNCIVRYIGKVDEISPGFLFGLELLVIFVFYYIFPY